MRNYKKTFGVERIRGLVVREDRAGLGVRYGGARAPIVDRAFLGARARRDWVRKIEIRIHYAPAFAIPHYFSRATLKPGYGFQASLDCYVHALQG